MTAIRQQIDSSDQPVTFPCNVVTPSSPPRNGGQQHSRSERTGSGPSEAVLIRPFRVLVVDDDPFLRPPIVLMLSRRNMEVVEAENGLVAMKMIMAGSFDLVISDLNMPEMDGMALLHWVKKNRPAMEMIIMSGELGEETVLKIMRAGAADFLSKPFTSEELTQAVDRCRTRLYSLPGHQQAIKLIKQSMHDVRGGLVNVAGMARLLQKKRREPAPENDGGILDALVVEVHKIINQAEEYSAQALALALGGELNEELLDLQSDIIDAVLVNLSFEIERKKIRITNQTLADRRLPLIRGSRVVVKSILRNLFDNAIKYSPDQGSILYAIVNKGASFQVIVENDSVTFPASQAAADQKHLPHAAQADSGAKRSGLGLGLNMASFFAGRCGGEIRKEHRPDGARFIFSLPMATKGPEEKRFIKEFGK